MSTHFEDTSDEELLEAVIAIENGTEKRLLPTGKFNML